MRHKLKLLGLVVPSGDSTDSTDSTDISFELTPCRKEYLTET
jgi:hypothetical protein